MLHLHVEHVVVGVDGPLEIAQLLLVHLSHRGVEVDALVAATAALEQSLPGHVQEAVRGEAQPVGRNLAEIRGLMNQVLRRLSTLESDLLAERNARVDDLALLVDLVSSGWKGVDARLGRIEAVVNRLEHQQDNRGAIVYRMEDRRADAANS